MLNGSKKREKLEDLNGAKFDEVFDSEEDLVDEDEKVIGKFSSQRCVSGTRKRKPSSDHSLDKISISVDGNPYAENNSEEVDRGRKYAYPSSISNRQNLLSLQSFSTVRGGPIMLYSDVKVEIVEDPDRPCSVQSDDSFDEEDQFPIHRPRTHQVSLTEDLSNSFSSAISFTCQGSPRPGPSNRRPSINNSPLPMISSEINSRKRLLSTEILQSKRWKSEEPSNIISAPEITKPMIRKNCGYFVSPKPSYDALLNFYEQTITADPGDYCYYYKQHPISLTPDDSTVQYKEFLNSTYYSARCKKPSEPQGSP